tara:strand:- start:14084 stop:15874 length:1791 start_codon:yes stop_codon:yes gene_type:complete
MKRFVILIHIGLFLWAGVARAALQPEQVLVLYNSAEADSVEVSDYYQLARPGVLSFDFDDPTLLPGTISYEDFIDKIRTPLRDHLELEDLESAVIVFVLTKGLPHRIQQISPNTSNLGDSPSSASTAYNEGNITYASVDSELTLLQFDLEDGEAGDNLDSAADRAVANPYFRETSTITSFDRSEITNPDREFYATVSTYGWWRGYEVIRAGNNTLRRGELDAGHMYLTARLDAATVEDVKAMIDRAQNITFRRYTDAILLDSDGRTEAYQEVYDIEQETDIDDYEEVHDLLAGMWDRLDYDFSTDFFSGETDTFSYSSTEVTVSGPIVHLNSYGTNHSGSGERNYLSSYEGQLVPGASFAAYESFGASALGGVSSPLSQAQLTEWIAAGGTFAIGPVWEPFTFGISRSAVFLDGFLNEGLTYVEAAWSSIMPLSWQSVVLGDPLATATVIDGEPYYLWTLEFFGTTPTVDDRVAMGADFDEDRVVNAVEYSLVLDPSGFSEAPLEPVGISGGGFPELALAIHSTAPVGVTYIFERSETLAAESWSEFGRWTQADGGSGSASFSETATEDGTLLTITDSEAVAVGESVFFRVSVELE